MIYQIVDWAATLIECLVVLAATIQISGRRWNGRKYAFTLCLFSLGDGLIVAFLNSIQSFSLITPLISIVYLVCVSTFLSNGAFILRAAACFMSIFVILVIGYIWMLIVCLVYGGSIENSFQEFMAPGPPRCLYLLLDKTSDIVLYLLLRKHLHRLATLRKRWMFFLLWGSAFAYGVTQYLMNAILSHDIPTMQQASIASFLVFLLFFLVFSILLLTIASRDQERTQRLVLQQTQRLMEKNYQMLHQDLRENAKRIHDFHHHLQAILGIAEQANDQKTQEYIQSLLEISYRDVKLCNSGNDVIDAVINCSAAEAARSHIDFRYEVELSSSLSQISCRPLCGTGEPSGKCSRCLQEDSGTTNRFVQVHVHQNKGFVVIQVTNSADHNPFTPDGRLVTDKENSELHGLGLKSIQDTVDQYNGYLTNSYEDHKFQSEALLCFSTI